MEYNHGLFFRVCALWFIHVTRSSHIYSVDTKHFFNPKMDVCTYIIKNTFLKFNLYIFKGTCIINDLKHVFESV